MSSYLKKLSPYILILLGLFLLFYMEQAIPAGVCLSLGIVMTMEKYGQSNGRLRKEKIKFIGL